MSGQTGHDIRLASEITQKRKQAIQTLGLDDTDTTPRELFFALRRRAANTNQALEKELQIIDTDSPEVLVAKVIAFIDKLGIQRDVWTLKHAVVKQLLKQQPPKKLLKILGLRSITSVLKRTNAYELLSLAHQIETAEWSNKMRMRYKKLKPVDFQTCCSSIFVTDKSRVEKLHKGGYKSSRILVPNYETGTVLIVPPAGRFQLDVLALTMALLQTLYDLRVHSAYFRLISVNPDFGAKLHLVLQEGLPGKLQKTEIGWPVLQRHFTGSPESFGHTLEQPHLQHEDIVLVPPLEALVQALPEARFWIQHRHVFLVDGSKPVSMNLMDVVINVSNQLTFESRAHTHLQHELWEEIGLRYLQNEAVRNAVILQIEDGQF
jgi:hypothetical protein